MGEYADLSMPWAGLHGRVAQYRADLCISRKRESAGYLNTAFGSHSDSSGT
jgi:hypothetical protein